MRSSFLPCVFLKNRKWVRTCLHIGGKWTKIGKNMLILTVNYRIAIYRRTIRIFLDHIVRIRVGHRSPWSFHNRPLIRRWGRQGLILSAPRGVAKGIPTGNTIAWRGSIAKGSSTWNAIAWWGSAQVLHTVRLILCIFLLERHYKLFHAISRDLQISYWVLIYFYVYFFAYLKGVGRFKLKFRLCFHFQKFELNLKV